MSGMETIEQALREYGYRLREDPIEQDREAVREMIAESGFFSDAEVDVAVELVDERLSKGLASGYDFAFLEQGSQVIGYACYGEIPCTVGSFDLYWVAVSNSLRGRGIGRLLMQIVESRLASRAARKIYIETSTRPLYDPTRAFYLRCGYTQVAELPDFYAPGDGKAVYEKSVYLPLPRNVLIES